MRTKTAPTSGMALVVVTLLVVGSMTSGTARAFCGFYVGHGEERLYANATRVVLLRSGTRTVLSMQNDYEGPVEDFAMVVPVPTVLRRSDVRTLPRAIFDRVDRLTAPRLVEYWEQDPCSPGHSIDDLLEGAMAGGARSGGGGGASVGAARPSVRVEAEFVVGEYEIVILSADESVALETWLRGEGYRIPSGAHAALRPYVEQGMKFFVARVNPDLVVFENGRAVLSPLRVHYDAPELTLPIRLGMLSSHGAQDLIVHVLSPLGRYEVANRTNTTLPTNDRVLPRTVEDFGAFYERMFARALAGSPGAVVTEYAWGAGSCDPCPTPGLDPREIASLGDDIAPGAYAPSGYTITRLHYRYRANEMADDLVFRVASPIEGGVGEPSRDGFLTTGVHRSAWRGNNFQGRYVILHEWEGPVACDAPRAGVWGGPVEVRGTQSQSMTRGRVAPRASIRRDAGSSPRRPRTTAPTSPAAPPPRTPRPTTRRER